MNNTLMKKKVFVCHSCKQEFTWDGGNDVRGNIYICEECGNPICTSCMLENNEYRKKIYQNIDGISGLNKLQCLNCFKN